MKVISIVLAIQRKMQFLKKINISNQGLPIHISECESAFQNEGEELDLFNDFFNRLIVF